jgi:phosphosulfolactate synthase
MQPYADITWESRLMDPSNERKPKPRYCGLTMIIDKGLGYLQFRDLLEIAAPHIDFIKLGFGTAGVTPIPLLQKKLQLASEADVHLYPGGTFFEIAHAQNQTKNYLETLRKIGFSWVEISDGTISITAYERQKAIQLARSYSFQVITEIGKKAQGSFTPAAQLIEQFKADRLHGAEYVIVEGRESGKNIGVFDALGGLDEDYVSNVSEALDSNHLIWEAPLHKQQAAFIRLSGRDVNLGNIAPGEVLSVESLRRGLRADTFPFISFEPIGGA